MHMLDFQKNTNNWFLIFYLVEASQFYLLIVQIYKTKLVIISYNLLDMNWC